MAVTPTTLISRKYAEDSQTTQYISTSVKTIIDKFTVSNVTANAATIAINVVANGGAAGASNLVLPTRTIAPGECYTVDGLIGHVMETRAFISTIAGTASALVLYASGRSVS